MSGTPSINQGASIRFILDGDIITVNDVDPTRTVLQYLREDLGRTGTKEGCAEGDCGACTVALVELDRTGSRLRVRAVNSCIQFLPTLDGRELFTVESLRAKDGALHPVQQAMLDCHGSQCGFCTPGFVMSLFAQYKNSSSPTRREIDDALAGNLCRCTGYQPIVNAAQKMYELDTSQGDNWVRQVHSDDSEVSADEEKKIADLKALQSDRTLSITQGDRFFYAPRSVAEFASLLEEHQDATILAGGTDVGLWVTKQHRNLQKIIYTGRVDGLTDIVIGDEQVDIGAAVTISDAMPVLAEYFPQLDDLFKRFASPPIRNAGTLGGNVANGSPIGDSLPALLALDALLVLRRGAASRTLPLQQFYLGYQESALAEGEFVERIQIPWASENSIIRSYKISKRFDQDISAVCAAYRLILSGDTVSDIRIAYGGLAAIPKRATATENSLKGAAWCEATVRAAMNALAEDFQPISDMRSSADYRLTVCQNLLYRFWLEAGDNAIATDVYRYGR